MTLRFNITEGILLSYVKLIYEGKDVEDGQTSNNMITMAFTWQNRRAALLLSPCWMPPLTSSLQGFTWGMTSIHRVAAHVQNACECLRSCVMNPWHRAHNMLTTNNGIGFGSQSVSTR